MGIYIQKSTINAKPIPDTSGFGHSLGGTATPSWMNQNLEVEISFIGDNANEIRNFVENFDDIYSFWQKHGGKKPPIHEPKDPGKRSIRDPLNSMRKRVSGFALGSEVKTKKEERLRMDDIEEQINSMELKEIIDAVDGVLGDDDYEENKFTDMVTSIVERFYERSTISDKQRRVVEMHLKINAKLWF